MPDEAPVVDWIALHLIPGLGPIAQRHALARFGDPGKIAHRVPVPELVRLSRSPRAELAQRITEARRGLPRRAAKELRRCKRNGIRAVSCADPEFPPALEPFRDAPILLYVKGELTGEPPRIAVIGSRRPTAYGKRVALGMSGGLAELGAEVISGGARGIDTCAHRGALEAGGRTVAVLGSGLLRPYPAENAALFERVTANGALVSEFPLDTPPVSENFPRRNRIISGLATAVVVVEAAARSDGVAFWRCRSERTETSARELPDGASDPRGPLKAPAARARAPAGRGRRAPRGPLQHRGDLGAEPEDPCRPACPEDP